MKKTVVFVLVIIECMFLPTRMAFGKAKKDTILTGIYLKSLHDMQPSDYSYGVDFYLWLSNSHDTLSFENVDIINSKQLEKFHVMHDTDDGHYISYLNCKGRMHHSWNLLKYPFDRQKLHIRIENNDDTANSVLLEDKKGFIIDPDLSIPEWKIVRNWTRDTIHTYASDFGYHRAYKEKSSYYGIVYEIEIRRNSWEIFFKLFCGLYIAFLVAFLSFYIKSKNIDPRIGLCIGALFAAVANNYIVNSNIPASAGFSFVDELHSLTFLYIFFALVVAIVSDYHIQKENLEVSQRINRIAKVAYIASYVVTNCLLILNARQ